MRRRARDHGTSITLIGGKGRAGPSPLLHTTLEGPTNGVSMYVNARWRYVASNGPCFMVTWTVFKNHLLEVGLTQHWETMALRTFKTIDLFYFTMREDPHEQKFIETTCD